MTLIREVHGDLLEATENIIVHSVNCQGVMGSGIAKQVKDKWYEVYKDYKRLCDTWLDTGLLGHAQLVRVDDDKFVANVFGQKQYGYNGERFTNYEALYEGLENVAKYARRFNLSVALPYKLGCDRGGADWDIVYAMIESVFKNHTQPITIYNINGQWQHSFVTNSIDPMPLSQIISKELILN